MSIQFDSQSPDDFKEKLASDMYTAVSAARMAAQIEKAAILDTRIVVTIYDKFYTPMWECANYLELAASWPRNQVPTGKLSLGRTDPAADHVLTCHDTTVPITIEVGKLLWSGRVKVAHDNFNAPGKADFVECELEGDYAWLLKILAWPNFLLPLQIQVPSRGVAIGPAISCLKYVLAVNAFRLQSGLWNMVNNLLSFNLDWRSWFSQALMTDLEGDNGKTDIADIVRMLRTPIYVVPTNPLKDTSPFITVNWRMDKIGTIFEKIVQDNGLSVEVTLWRPGDPQPAGVGKYPLTVATIVVDIKDRMGVVGPTGTFFDGILRQAVDLQASVFGDIFAPFLNSKGEYKPDGWNIAPAIGIHFEDPWVVLNADDPKSGIQGKMSHHTPESWRVIVGGKSPKWIDDLINATFSWILDMIMVIVGITGIASNMFDGLFNDVLLAFQLADNYNRRVKMGPYGYPEVFVPTGSAPYTLDAIFAMKREMWNTRGYISGQVTFQNGIPYEVGRDISPNSLASVIRNNMVYTDYIENIILSDTRQDRATVMVQIGDGKREEAPVVRAQRQIANFGKTINAILLTPE